MLTEHMNAPSTCLSKKEVALAKQCRECGINSKSISHLLNKRNDSGYNIDWNPAQIYRIRQKEDFMKGLSQNATSAENLVTSFENRDDVDYLYVTYHPEDGMILIKGKDVKRKCTTQDDGQLRKVWNENMLSTNGRLLVIFLFATKEERRHTRMHPEFCAADTTFGTEKTKKELFHYRENYMLYHM